LTQATEGIGCILYQYQEYMAKLPTENTQVE